MELWSDSRRDHYFQRLRQNLLAMSKELEHPRNWRPRILVFSDEAERRTALLRFASWIDAWGPEALAAKSRDASLVFLPLRLGRTALLGPFDRPIETLIAALPVVALALAAEDIDLEADPEEPAPAAEEESADQEG